MAPALRTMLAAVLASAATATSWPEQPGPFEPWGIHLAYGSSDGRTEMTVMWSTYQPVAQGIVKYGPIDGPMTQSFLAETWAYAPAGGFVPQQLNRARLTGLLPGTTYAYVVGDGGSPGNWCAPSNFTTQTVQPAPMNFAVYGDMGISANAEATMPWLEADVASGLLDAVIHIGDLAYNLEDNNGMRGDAFMQQITPVASRLPYHTCPGNHEDAFDFEQYRMRMGAAMPLASSASAGGNGTFHSVDMGLVHWVLVSSEVYFSLQPHSAGLLLEQTAWLKADLAAVNRTKTPWVILGLHQPFYCSANDDSDDCHALVSLVRTGLESIIMEGGVDLVFGAHEHSYERNFPVGPEFQWDNVTGASAYVDYDRPVHILTGAAGCPEDQDPWQPTHFNPFSAVRINDYGYSRMYVRNASHLELEYVDNVKGQVLDSVLLVKHSHGPFKPKQHA